MSLTRVPETKIAEFANSTDLAEVAHYEPLQQDLRCLNPDLHCCHVFFEFSI